MVKNKKITWEDFLEERKEVLASWKTGSDKQLDFDEAIKYLRSPGSSS